MSTNIEQVQTALTEFSKVEAGLAALRQQYAGVVYDVSTSDGMADAKAARLALREPRYEIERIRKSAKAPILALGKQLDADAARITAEIEKIESPIDQQIKAEEARKEAEKQAKIAAEAARVQDIQERIAELRGCPILTAASGSKLIAQHLADLSSLPVDESFAEFRQQAEDAKAAGLARLGSLHQAALTHEAEQARIEAERAELARLRAEQAERDRVERERIAAEERAAREAREKADREAAEKLRQEREALAVERRKQEAEAAAERERIESERREQAAAAAEEAEKLARERAELERQQEELRQAKQPPPAPVSRPTDAEIIEAVAGHFGVTAEVAAGWLFEMRAAA